MREPFYRNELHESRRLRPCPATLTRSPGRRAISGGFRIRASSPGEGKPFDTWLETLKAQMIDLLSNHERPATLIGWSLGGLYAREIGKLMAMRVRQVITIGTPFNAAADHTKAGWLFRLLSGCSATLDPALSRRLRTPPPLRTTSINSRSDGVVAWQALPSRKAARPCDAGGFPPRDGACDERWTQRPSRAS